ncbi:hypothetical protein H0H10_01555 [Streptomyces sp. TRM S81-3]|uniref:Uncharacterized protein n=1 Tax=Streptomyces griseicoloratus TaxID=2752516 RepID=A0A926KYJ4_9ACTN|nr:hypothetical protein [Streptomyces griseicoloratus]MBD0417874.1 hypothetical protein [Streptomyces griseicoloratus]
MAFDEPGQALVQRIDLPGELFDALGRLAQAMRVAWAHGVLVAPAVSVDSRFSSVLIARRSSMAL